MQVAEAFEAKQEATEFVLPAEDALNGVEPLLEDLLIKKWFAATFYGFPASGIGVDIRYHAAVENRFSVKPTIVNAIKTDDRAL